MDSFSGTERKPTFVLVHGAWHGGWCYGRTALYLRELGYHVHTPTLSGLGERSHLVSRGIGLQTHIDDVVNLLEWENLHDVVLCGHSYGGMVISGVAERVRRRIRRLSYIDAFVPQPGQALFDTLSVERVDEVRALTLERGFGWLIPPVPATVFNVNTNDIGWVDGLCVPHPLRCFEERVHYTDRVTSLPRQYILATDFPGSHFPDVAERLRDEPGWRVDNIKTGHDVMIDDPIGLAKLLIEGSRG
ncbi:MULTISPECIES: alpha/beta hydrolase [Burkholderia]|uniref:Pyrethroid hydrolase n=1 Tax=Burkholderia pseudomultivorans TaxID=1207504 RepID=A0ABU2E9V3_9BURK|nr:MULTISPECIES: alpha/beta hydrolase [Burkholderia]MBR8428384.1 alpha/beta hydrolase [Burkholderia cenocepacia]MDN7669391.1 alpha/beta hydrolase [Burkholderia vietnamiensis]MDR8730510.1 Pyrethroid hydrolase [Burkholderia pseudomultivorans]MDR8738427.1 Pyrethroid hydrolase [Burkholderia pseudomultivorans]MDR8744840.1 Pyrethroid hydrolase [Burkholderia pseudomultivorans]